MSVLSDSRSLKPEGRVTTTSATVTQHWVAKSSYAQEIVESDEDSVKLLIKPLKTEESRPSLRLVWKAYIQTPVRLTEADAWPVARPECFGTLAPTTPVAYTLNRTIREYKFMLPSLTESSDVRNRLDSSRISRLTARPHFSSGRAKKQLRFLKTFPKKHPEYPELQRSPHFETFLMVPEPGNTLTSETSLSINSDKLSVQGTITDRTRPSAEETKYFEETSESCCSSEGIFHQMHSTRKNFPASLSSHASSVSRYKGDSIFRKTISKIHANFPVLPYRSKVHRSMATLQSIQEQRIQSTYTDMVEGAMVHLNSQVFTESEKSDSSPQLCARSRATSHLARFISSRSLLPTVIDLEDTLPGAEILDAKIRDHDMHLPIKAKEEKQEEQLRKLYQVTILKEPALRDLLTSVRLDALPNHLRHLVRMGSLYKQVSSLEKSPDEQNIEPDNENLHPPGKNSQCEIAIKDVEHLWIEARVLTVGLFIKWMTKIKPNPLYDHLSARDAEQGLRHFGKLLRDTSNVATATTRADLHSVISACVHSPRLIPNLWASIDDWLDNLLGSLYSPDRTVREETCYVLAYLFTNNVLVESIRNSATIDIGYDVTVAVLRAIELNQSSFMHFYSLLALMIEGCPMFSILNAIMEIGPHSTSILINHLWPRLVYYALRFWNGNQFLRDRILLKTLNESIEKAYVRGISRKNAKLAQIQLSRRFKILTKPTTVWLDEWKQFEL